LIFTKRTKSQTLPTDLSESDIQIQLVDYLNLIAVRCGFLFFSVANEGTDRANPARLAKLKRMGFKPGVADLVFIKSGKAYFLEMKKPGKSQSDNQRDFQIDVAKASAQYAVAWSLDDAITILRDWQLLP